jgi:hypothetical protein
MYRPHQVVPYSRVPHLFLNAASVSLHYASVSLHDAITVKSSGKSSESVLVRVMHMSQKQWLLNHKNTIQQK